LMCRDLDGYIKTLATLWRTGDPSNKHVAYCLLETNSEHVASGKGDEGSTIAPIRSNQNAF
jgi:hypothetical protein